MSYKEEYKKSIENPEQFWQEKANKLEWFSTSNNILSKYDKGICHWFENWTMNTSHMALDFHVNNGRANQVAIYYDSPVRNTKRSYTYTELRDAVAKFTGVLKEQGIEKGDRVVIYMPMIPEAVIAMLSCARIGAIHSVVFGGFAAPELAIRINDAKPKLVLSASCGVEVNKVIPYKPLLDKAIRRSKYKVNKCIIYQCKEYNAKMLKDRDLDWQREFDKAQAVDSIAVKGSDLLYILYTSGTTATPKGITRENGGYVTALKYSMDAIYNINPGEIFWSASDIGWVVGHSYIVYAPLLQGATTVLYEGKPIMTPDAGVFWRVISEYNVKSLFAAPTAFRAVRKEDPKGDLIKKYDISSLKAIFVAGERLDPSTYNWLKESLQVPVIDNWWQTETGWPIAANPIGIEEFQTKAGSATFPVPGYSIKILDEEGEEVESTKQGNIAIKLPLPPGCVTSVWGSEDKFKSVYLDKFPGYYSSGDGGYFDKDNYLFVMGRTDDTINVAGHRFSTGEIEEILSGHEHIAECAVVGGYDEIKGQIPVGFIVLKTGLEINIDDIKQSFIDLIREYIGAVACYKDTVIVDRLPKTRSGKIVRKTMQKILNNESYAVPATIDDPLVLSEIKTQIKKQLNKQLI